MAGRLAAPSADCRDAIREWVGARKQSAQGDVCQQRRAHPACKGAAGTTEQPSSCPACHIEMQGCSLGVQPSSPGVPGACAAVYGSCGRPRTDQPSAGVLPRPASAPRCCARALRAATGQPPSAVVRRNAWLLPSSARVLRFIGTCQAPSLRPAAACEGLAPQGKRFSLAGMAKPSFLAGPSRDVDAATRTLLLRLTPVPR